MPPKGREFEDVVNVGGTGRVSCSGEGVSTMSGGFRRLGRGGEGALGWREEGSNGGRAPPNTEDSN